MSYPVPRYSIPKVIVNLRHLPDMTVYFATRYTLHSPSGYVALGECILKSDTHPEGDPDNK